MTEVSHGFIRDILPQLTGSGHYHPATMNSNIVPVIWCVREMPLSHTCILNTHFAHSSGTTVNHTMPVVTIRMRKGFSREQKRTVVKEFTGTLVKTLGVDPDLVTIMIDEHELENIGKAGKLRCD